MDNIESKEHKTSDNIDTVFKECTVFEECTELDYVYRKLYKIEKMIGNYDEFVNHLWNDEIKVFNNSNDCNLLLDLNKFNTKCKFVDVMNDTPYYNQLLVSQINFNKRLEILQIEELLYTK
jgi:hypothetical protein